MSDIGSAYDLAAPSWDDELGFEPSDTGVYGWSAIKLPDGGELRFSAEVLLPNVREAREIRVAPDWHM